MFTGIIETLGVVVGLEREQENLHLFIKSTISFALKVDQSVAHNGVCLTVVAIEADVYKVTAIKETINKTNIGSFALHDLVNLERGMKLGDRLDGHLVQGHVDQTGVCTSVEAQGGSTVFTFSYAAEKGNVTIEKGSITINGVSLTVFNSTATTFSVAIIPYTMENTMFKNMEVGTVVNLEFDVIGKYVARLTQQ